MGIAPGGRTACRLAELAIVLSLISGLLLAGGCDSRQASRPRPFTPQALNQRIPDDLRMIDRPAEATWHVCEQAEQKLFFAYTHSGEYLSPVPSRQYHLQVVHLGEEGKPLYSWVSGGPLTGGFHAVAGRVRRLVEGAKSPSEWTEGMNVSGIALDERVVLIEAATTTGRTLKTAPLNGFWYLEVDRAESGEAWSRVSALDAQGRAVHEYGPVTERSPVEPVPAITICDGSGDFEVQEAQVKVGCRQIWAYLSFPDCVEEQVLRSCLSLSGLKVLETTWALSQPLGRFVWSCLSLRLELTGNVPGLIRLGEGLYSQSGGVLASPVELEITLGTPAGWHLAMGGERLAPAPYHVLRSGFTFELSFTKDVVRDEVDRRLKAPYVPGDDATVPGALRTTWESSRRVRVEVQRLLFPMSVDLAGVRDTEGVRIEQSRSGVHVLIPAEEHDLYEVTVDPGKEWARRLVAGPLPFPYTPWPSPDGTRVVLREVLPTEGEYAETRLSLYDTGTGAMTEICRSAQGQVTWRPDSQAFVVGSDRLALYSRDGTLLAQEREHYALAFAVSPDGKEVAFLVPVRGRELEAADVFVWTPATGKVRLLAPAGMTLKQSDGLWIRPLMSWDPAGDRVLIWYRRYGGEEPPAAVSVRVSDGVVTRLEAEPVIQWPSPDRRLAVIVGDLRPESPNRCDLYLRRADGTTVRLTDTWDVYAGTVSWHYGGELFAVNLIVSGHVYDASGRLLGDIDRFVCWLPGPQPRALIAVCRE